MSRDRRPNYTPAFDRAEEGVRRQFARLVEELEAATALAVDLLAEPEAGRRELLCQPRFQALGLCDLLLERCREAWTEEPTRAVKLAALAVEVSTLLDAAHYSAELVEDASARAWAHLGNACRIGSDLRRAEEALTIAWQHHREAGEDAYTEAEILSFEGSLRNSQGQFDEAVRLFDRALTIYREGRDRHREGRTLLKKGMAFGYGGRLKEAIRLTRRGLAAIDAAEEPRLEVAARHNLIVYLHESGDSRQALRTLERSRGLYDVLGEPLHRVRLRWLEGRIDRDLGRLDEAEAALGEARAAFLDRGIAFDAALVSLDLAMVHARRGNTGEVQRLAAEMLPIFESRDVHSETLAVLVLLRQAVETEKVTLEVLEQLAGQLRRGQERRE
ncbi:MAG TPA: tetratricopeptide repeat protein [Thermoanaerobaculia bacterium]|nr:tetratricopeptide repeat protein [Thermoanaerobaculia bacterium]